MSQTQSRAASTASPTSPDSTGPTEVNDAPTDHAPARATMESARSDSPPPKRQPVVVLGASNATRALGTVYGSAHQFVGEPIDLYAAIGRGRSFGITSSLLGRALPSILDCGLWRALEAAKPGDPPLALITDIGNDVMYRQSAADIAGWVETCVEHLQRHGSNIVMTLMPMASIDRVTGRQYAVASRILFPTHERMPREQAIGTARELNDRLIDLAERLDVRTVEQPLEWYGIDPVHIRLNQWRQVWPHVLAHWQNPADGKLELIPKPEFSLRLLFSVRFNRPERMWLFGREFTAEQPCCVLEDGSTLGLY